MRLAAPALALAALALTLTACASNEERNEKIVKAEAKHEREASERIRAADRALAITHESAKVKVTATALLKGTEGYTAVVELHNLTGSPLRDVPIAIDVRNGSGATVYSNDTPGLAAGLNSASLVPARGTATWIDDQVQATAGTPASISARVGEGSPVSGAIPSLSVEDARQYTDPTNGPALEGSVVNRSSVAQQELIVSAVARRGGTIVAAGRAVVSSVSGGASARFQLFFAGDPHEGAVEVEAPASTIG